MNGINAVLAGLALSGFLPMAVYFYKKKKVDRILATGQMVRARIYTIIKSTKGNQEVVYYYFMAFDGKQYTGSLVTSQGKHKMNEYIEVYYQPENPKQNTVKGAWASKFFLVFVVAIALAILFMTYKMYEEVNGGTL